MEEIFEKMAKKIISREQLVALLEQINLVQQLIFKNINIPLSEKAEGISEDFKKEIQKLEEKKIISKNPEANQIFFENFKNYLLNLPQIKIVIAFLPREEFLKRISHWLNKEMKQKVILDLVSDPKIVGGAIIEYQGKRLDFSIAKEIDKLENPQVDEN